MHHQPDDGFSSIAGKRPQIQAIQGNLQVLVDLMAEPVIEWDSSLMITGMNKAARIWFDQTGTDLAGQSLLTLFAHPEQCESLKRLLSTTGSSWIECRTHQGQWRKAHWSWVILEAAGNQSGERIAIITASEPISKPIATLPTAQFVPTEDLRSTLDAIPASVAMVDQDGIIRLINKHWHNFGVSNSFQDTTQGLGWNYLEVCRKAAPSSPQAEQAHHLIKAALESRISSYELEYPCHGPVSKRWFRMLIAPATLQNQTFALVMHLDITEKKLAVEALRMSEARYRSLVAATAQSVWTTSVDGQVTEDQPSWRALTGQSPDEIQGWGWFDAIHPEDRPQIKQAWAYALETKSLLSLEHRVRIVTGEYRTFAVRAVPITNEAGRVYEWIGAHTDITDQKRALDELKKAETQLRHSQRMEAIGQLAGGVAHDFNNLLMVISGYADLAATKLGKSSPVYRFLEEIRQASRSASGVTRQLLAFSRKQDQQLKSLNLTNVVTQLHKLLGRVIGEDIKLVTSLATDTALVLADPTQIEQVVLNLVVNARDAMPTGGTLTLQTKNVIQTTEERTLHFTVPPGKYVAVIVTDTGCGMDEPILERIYEPFFTTKEAHKGTGLGLSTVYGIVQQSNGYILVESQPGQGTTFTVLLPQTPGLEYQSVTDEPVIRANVSNTTILVVEDEDSVRAMVREVLTLWGYHVLEAMSGETAIKLVDQFNKQIDLLLTDVVMPGMSGAELAQFVQTKHPSLKILFMSGYIADASHAVGVVSELENFISKPFTPLTLVKAIQTVLNHPVDS